MKLIGNPEIMRLCTQKGLSRPLLMKFTMTMLSNLRDPRGGDAVDRMSTRSRRWPPPPDAGLHGPTQESAPTT